MNEPQVTCSTLSADLALDKINKISECYIANRNMGDMTVINGIFPPS